MVGNYGQVPSRSNRLGALVAVVALAMGSGCGLGSSSEPFATGGLGPFGTSAGSEGGSDDGGGVPPFADEGSSDDGGQDSGSGEPPTMLLCDDGFSFNPESLGSGSITEVAFTFGEPLTWVELDALGPGQATIGEMELVGSDPWTWVWPTTDLAPGVWTFSFAHGEDPTIIAVCQREVADTGLPPPLPGDPPPPPPPDADCGEGQVCGDAGPNGGTCNHCPMVGDCLDPPSPYGPGGPGSWSCLDNAGCEDSGVCRIWCPGEPCNEAEHPDGCPQGVEACFVSATFHSYEEACASCCESRYHEPTGEYACWDSAFNLCRYPTDCGLPLW